MGRAPKDYDIATSAPPEAIRPLFRHTDLVGAHFGVVLVVEDGAAFEVATFRRDGVYIDHRRPSSVSFGTLSQDAGRRDFTINALYYDPISDQLVDPVNGRNDLERRCLRAIGDPWLRFEEDALRMMRAIRFSARLDFEIEAATWEALCAQCALIGAVSAERIRDELLAILTGPHPGRGLHRLSESGLLARILPEVEAMRGVGQPQEYHPEGDVFIHTALALDRLESPTPTLAMGTLLHDVGKPPTFSIGPDRIHFYGHDKEGAELADLICRRLRFPNSWRLRVVALVSRHMRFFNVKDMKPSTLRRFVAAPSFAEDLALHRADALASNGCLENWQYCHDKHLEFQTEAPSIIPPPLVSGADLIECGFTPGPRFREILNAVSERQMNGHLSERDEALAWIRAHYPEKPEAPEDRRNDS